MQSEADIRKVVDAALKADPNQEDDVTSMLIDTLHWVLGVMNETADGFIESYVTEA